MPPTSLLYHLQGFCSVQVAAEQRPNNWSWELFSSFRFSPIFGKHTYLGLGHNVGLLQSHLQIQKLLKIYTRELSVFVYFNSCLKTASIDNVKASTTKSTELLSISGPYFEWTDGYLIFDINGWRWCRQPPKSEAPGPQARPYQPPITLLPSDLSRCM